MEEEKINTLNLDKPFDHCEWCFQFNDEEPIVLVSQENENDDTLTIQFKNTPGSNIVFTSKTGQQFKIFAREKLNNGNQEES